MWWRWYDDPCEALLQPTEDRFRIWSKLVILESRATKQLTRSAKNRTNERLLFGFPSQQQRRATRQWSVWCFLSSCAPFNSISTDSKLKHGLSCGIRPRDIRVRDTVLCSPAGLWRSRTTHSATMMEEVALHFVYSRIKYKQYLLQLTIF